MTDTSRLTPATPRDCPICRQPLAVTGARHIVVTGGEVKQRDAYVCPRCPARFEAEHPDGALERQ